MDDDSAHLDLQVGLGVALRLLGERAGVGPVVEGDNGLLRRPGAREGIGARWGPDPLIIVAALAAGALLDDELVVAASQLQAILVVLGGQALSALEDVLHAVAVHRVDGAADATSGVQQLATPSKT